MRTRNQPYMELGTVATQGIAGVKAQRQRTLEQAPGAARRLVTSSQATEAGAARGEACSCFSSLVGGFWLVQLWV